MITQKAVDIIKDLFTYGTGAFVIAFGMYEVAHLAELHVIDGATAMTFYTTTAAAAVAFLFGVALSRSNTRAFQQGLNTPVPADAGGAPNTLVQAQTATVQGGDPTVVTGSGGTSGNRPPWPAKPSVIPGDS